MPPTSRSFAAGHFGLVLDGSDFVGFVKSVTGGAIKGEVAEHNLGTSLVRKKNLADVNYEPFTVEVGMGMGKGFYDWIRASFERCSVFKSAAVHQCDFNNRSRYVREVMGVYISEVQLPTLDASSKEPAYLKVTFDPEDFRNSRGDGSELKARIAPATKQWLCANFRFSLGNLPTSRVSKIESFSWKQKITKDEIGPFAMPTKHPASVEISDIKLTLSTADLDPWAAWHRSFVIDGKCTPADELNGSITFLGPDMSEELATVDLLNVGIYALELEPTEANKETIDRFVVELYVEEMKFNYLVYDM